MNDSVKNGGSIEARTTKSLREATLNGVLIVSVSVLIIIGVILNILFYTRSMPVIDTLTGQKADASNLHDRIGVESKSIKGATSTQGYQDTIGKSASGYTGGGTGDDSGSGNNVNSLNVGSNSLPFSDILCAEKRLRSRTLCKGLAELLATGQRDTQHDPRRLGILGGQIALDGNLVGG